MYHYNNFITFENESLNKNRTLVRISKTSTPSIPMALKSYSVVGNLLKYIYFYPHLIGSLSRFRSVLSANVMSILINGAT